MGAAPSEQPQCYQHRLRASVFVEEKNLFCKRSFNISKTSRVLALYHESHLQDAAGSLVSQLKVFGLLVWRANECWSRTSLQFNSATCSSRLKLREGLLPHRQALIWRWANNALIK